MQLHQSSYIITQCFISIKNLKTKEKSTVFQKFQFFNPYKNTVNSVSKLTAQSTIIFVRNFCSIADFFGKKVSDTAEISDEEYCALGCQLADWVYYVFVGIRRLIFLEHCGLFLYFQVFCRNKTLNDNIWWLMKLHDRF